MTAPDLPTGWHLSADAYGERTLWDGATAVLRDIDVKCPPQYRDQLWFVLTAVLAPTYEQIRQAANDMCPNEGGCPGCRNHVETLIEWLATRTETKPEVSA